MNVLLLGGTKFLGRHIVDALLARSHGVTLYNRGRTNPEIFADLHKLRGDRESGPFDFEGLRFDAVIDTSAYLPHVVRRSCKALREIARQYVFISSISAYDPAVESPTEGSELAQLPAEANPAVFAPERYGALKVLCERAALDTFGEDRVAVVRPGLIVGPHDPTGRFTYWPHRVRRGGEVLAPRGPETRTQFVDVRDLAEWVVKLVEDGRAGTYNVTSRPADFTLGAVLEESREITGSDARIAWVDESFLLESGVEAWSELPLWIPSTEPCGFLNIDVSRALDAGLRIRPLRETIEATLAWLDAEPAAQTMTTGLPPDRERELLDTWRQRRA